ncbi:MAG: serine/threonine-protein kinase, partial [Myxococcota bacterium]
MNAASSVDVLRETLAAEGVESGQGIDETLGADGPRTVVNLGRSLPAARIGEGGDYEPREELGRGAMGSVEVARQRALDRDVAIKRLHDPSPHSVAALLEEAVVAGQLEHPNIVPIHAVVSDERGPAVVMKRISGVPWSKLLAEGEVPLTRHLEVLMQLCSAVAFANSRGVVHRDIKPANVMLGDFGEVVLVDWGLARRMNDGTFKDTRISGTPGYMAPEMVEKRADVRSDVFLLGATLHEILTGEMRHAGATIPQVLHSAGRMKPYRYGPSVPRELAAIACRACASSPDERFSDALGLRQALVEYLDHRAATQLADVARTRLERLRQRIASGVQYSEAQRLYGDARLLFEQSITAWPEGKAARRGRQQCLLAMAEYEVSLGHAVSASAIVEAMDAPPDALVAAVGALQVEREKEIARMAQLERDRDPRDGAAERGRAAWTLGLGTLALVAVFVTLRIVAPSYAPGALRLLIVSVAVGFVGLLVVLRWRRRSELNLINRRIAQIIVATLALSVTGRALGFASGASVAAILQQDALILLGGG